MLNPGENKIRLRGAVIDISDSIRDRAMDVAEEKMTADKKEMKGVSGMFSRFWKHGVWREYYENKFKSEATQAIRESGDLFEGEEIEDLHEKTVNAVVERFLTEYDEVIHKESGEDRRILGDSKRKGQRKKELKIKTQLEDLIKKYAAGKVKKSAFLNQKDKLIAYTSGFDKDLVAKGDMFADNMLEMADQVKAMVDHGQSLDDLDIDLEITIGRAKLGARTEAQFSYVEQISDKLTSSRIGRWVGNEAYVGTAVAVAYSIASVAGTRVLASSAASVVSLGGTTVAVGAIAAARESTKLQKERKFHARQRAVGIEFNDSELKRREELDAFQYETEDALKMIKGIVEAMDYNEAGELDLESFSKKDFMTLVNLTSKADSSVAMSDRLKKDLITYSSLGSVEGERLSLDIARAKAKVAIKKLFKDNKEEFDLDKFKDFDAYWKSVRAVSDKDIVTGSYIREGDLAFKSFKRKQALWTGVRAGIVGAAVGTAFQGAVAAVSPSGFGLFDSLRAGLGFGDQPKVAGDDFTVLDTLLRKGELPELGGEGKTIHHVDNGRIVFNGDFEVNVNEDNSFDLVGADGKVVVGGLNVDADGSLDADSLRRVDDAGGQIVENARRIINKVDASLHATQADWLEAEGVNRVDDVYFDNDTNFRDPKTGEYTSADFNELGLDWGGSGGSGIRADGNYEFDVSSLVAEGSFHKDISVDGVDVLKEGELKILLSLNADNADQVFELPVDANGKCVIDKDSMIGKILFEEVNGEAVFKGHMAQIAELRSVEAGTSHYGILATHEAAGLKGDIAFDGQEAQRVDGIISQINFEGESTTGLPPIIPLYWRNPLEKPTESESEEDESSPAPRETPPEPSKPKTEAAAETLSYANWVNFNKTRRDDERGGPSNEPKILATIENFKELVKDGKAELFLKSELGQNIKAWSNGQEGTMDPIASNPDLGYMLPADFKRMLQVLETPGKKEKTKKKKKSKKGKKVKSVETSGAESLKLLEAMTAKDREQKWKEVLSSLEEGYIKLVEQDSITSIEVKNLFDANDDIIKLLKLALKKLTMSTAERLKTSTALSDHLKLAKDIREEFAQDEIYLTKDGELVNTPPADLEKFAPKKAKKKKKKDKSKKKKKTKVATVDGGDEEDEDEYDEDEGDEEDDDGKVVVAPVASKKKDKSKKKTKDKTAKTGVSKFGLGATLTGDIPPAATPAPVTAKSATPKTAATSPVAPTATKPTAKPASKGVSKFGLGATLTGDMPPPATKAETESKDRQDELKRLDGKVEDIFEDDEVKPEEVVELYLEIKDTVEKLIAQSASETVQELVALANELRKEFVKDGIVISEDGVLEAVAPDADDHNEGDDDDLEIGGLGSATSSTESFFEVGKSSENYAEAFERISAGYSKTYLEGLKVGDLQNFLKSLNKSIKLLKGSLKNVSGDGKVELKNIRDKYKGLALTLRRDANSFGVFLSKKGKILNETPDDLKLAQEQQSTEDVSDEVTVETAQPDTFEEFDETGRIEVEETEQLEAKDAPEQKLQKIIEEAPESERAKLTEIKDAMSDWYEGFAEANNPVRTEPWEDLLEAAIPDGIYSRSRAGEIVDGVSAFLQSHKKFIKGKNKVQRSSEKNIVTNVERVKNIVKMFEIFSA